MAGGVEERGYPCRGEGWIEVLDVHAEDDGLAHMTYDVVDDGFAGKEAAHGWVRRDWR